jgi:hypothetical protein
MRHLASMGGMILLSCIGFGALWSLSQEKFVPQTTQASRAADASQIVPEDLEAMTDPETQATQEEQVDPGAQASRIVQAIEAARAAETVQTAQATKTGLATQVDQTAQTDRTDPTAQAAQAILTIQQNATEAIQAIRAAQQGVLIESALTLQAGDSSPPVASAATGAPAVPDGLFEDPRVTWKPKLDITATAVVYADGSVVSFKTGTPKVITGSAASALGTALLQCANNDGDWVGFYGEHPYELGIGDATSKRDVGRPSGFQGISLIGLETDPNNSDLSVLWGVHFMQHEGVQKDLTIANCVIDSHSIMPIQVTDLAYPDLGNLYLESLRFLTISNDQAHANPAGKNATTRVIRGHGGARWHIVNCDMLDGYVLGDGQSGASEHFFYYDGQRGDSEVIGCRVRNPQWCGVQAVGRYTDRFWAAGAWQERMPYGKLLIEDCWFENVGSAGTACINITGGMLDVTVKNCTYLAGYTLPATTGQLGPKGWLGIAIQTWTDRKVFQLADTIDPTTGVPYIDPKTGKPYVNPATGKRWSAGQGPITARGYSMDLRGSLADSPGIPTFPEDGFGSCRSITVIGGSYKRKSGTNPLFSFRDCAKVTIRYQGVQLDGTPTLPLTIEGGSIMVAGGGVFENNGKAGNGLVPAKIGPGYWQQIAFEGRKLPSTYLFVPVKIGAVRVALTTAELNTWATMP